MHAMFTMKMAITGRGLTIRRLHLTSTPRVEAFNLTVTLSQISPEPNIIFRSTAITIDLWIPHTVQAGMCLQ